MRDARRRRPVPLALGLACALAVPIALPGARATPAPVASTPPAAAAPSAPASRPVGLAAYAGLWRLDLKASDFGKSGRVPRIREDRIQHEGPWLAIHSLSVRSSGDTLRLEFKYNTNGEYTNHLGGQAVTTKGRKDGNTLRFSSTMQFLAFKFDVDEHWSLSADGGSLTQERTSRGMFGEDKSRFVYRRVP